MKVATVLYDGAEDLDIFGPWEVFAAGKYLENPAEMYMVARTTDPLRLSSGTRVLPDHTFDSAPLPDILFVPGSGDTAPALNDEKLLAFIQKCAGQVKWLASVCTGSEILMTAGPAKGKKITSHWMWIERLQAVNGKDKVLTNIRYVREGNLITAAGVSAGIDMALWMVGQLHGQDYARRLQHMIEYYPQPPYGGDV